MNEQDRYVFLKMCRRNFPAAFPAKYTFAKDYQEKFYYQHLLKPDWLVDDLCTFAIGCNDVAHGRNFASQIIEAFIQVYPQPNLNINWFNTSGWNWETHAKMMSRSTRELAILSDLNRQPEKLNILGSFDTQFNCTKFLIVKTDDIHEWLQDCYKPVEYAFQVKMKVDKPKITTVKKMTRI